MPNVFDQFDPPSTQTAAPVASSSNVFDQFDTSKTGNNVFDQFDAPASTASTTPAADQAAAEPSLVGRVAAFARSPSPAWMQPVENFIKTPLVSAETVVPFAQADQGLPNLQALRQGKVQTSSQPPVIASPVGQGIAQGVGEAASQFTSPGSLALLPLIPEGMAGKAVAAGFTAQGLAQYPDLYRQYQATNDPKEKARILATAATLIAPAAGLLPGRKAPIEPVNTELRNSVNERAGAAVPADNPAPAQSTILESATQPEVKPVVPKFDPVIRAAVRDDNGNIYTGTTHGEAISKVPPGINVSDQNAEGFVTQSGQFLTGSEAYQKAVDQGQIEGPAGKALDASLLNIANRKRTPITEQNAAQAATDIGGLSYGGVQSWPADTGIPSTLEFTITEPGKETTLSVPPGITPEELTARRDQKLADFATAEQPATSVDSEQSQTSSPQPPELESQQINANPPLEPNSEPQQTQEAPVTDAEPHVSAIANRFTQERAAKGEIGAVVPGQGASTADLVQRGLQMPPERAAEAVSRVMQGAGTSIDDAAAIRGEEARLSQRSNQLSKVAQANPKDLNAQVAADNAFKDLTDFHNGPVARLKNDWHAQGMAMQGEIPVDLSTLNGLREKWLKDTGEAPPASIEPTLKRAAERVSKTVAEEKGAMQQLSDGIDKATRSRKFPTADEVRANIRERLGLGPCEV